jgi:hypothetical protein
MIILIKDDKEIRAIPEGRTNLVLLIIIRLVTMRIR